MVKCFMLFSNVTQVKNNQPKIAVISPSCHGDTIYWLKPKL